MTHRDPPATQRLLQAGGGIRSIPAGRGPHLPHRRGGQVNKQLIHYCFGNKDGLYSAVLVHVAQRQLKH
jgi:hypothetical protein